MLGVDPQLSRKKAVFVQVIAGTGSNSTQEALELTRHAKEVGADGVPRLNILDVQVYTWRNNIALDIFRVEPPPDQVFEAEKWSRAEKRLDQIFKQPAGTARSKIRKPSANHIIVHRLDRLHKILLSIELRDTDELIIKYYKQLGYLKQTFKQDKYLIILLRLQYYLSRKINFL